MAKPGLPTRNPADEPTVDSLRPDYAQGAGPLGDIVRDHQRGVGARPVVNPADYRRPYVQSDHQQMNADPSDANPWPSAHGSLDPADFRRGPLLRDHQRPNAITDSRPPSAIGAWQAPAAHKSDTALSKVLQQGRDRGWLSAQEES